MRTVSTVRRGGFWVSIALSFLLFSAVGYAQGQSVGTTASVAPTTTPPPLEGELFWLKATQDLIASHKTDCDLFMNGTKAQPIYVTSNAVAANQVFLIRSLWTKMTTLLPDVRSARLLIDDNNKLSGLLDTTTNDVNNADTAVQLYNAAAKQANLKFPSKTVASTVRVTPTASPATPPLVAGSPSPAASPAAAGAPGTSLSAVVSNLSGTANAIGLFTQLFYNQTAISYYRFTPDDSTIMAVVQRAYPAADGLRWLGHSQPDPPPQGTDPLDSVFGNASVEAAASPIPSSSPISAPPPDKDPSKGYQLQDLNPAAKAHASDPTVANALDLKDKAVAALTKLHDDWSRATAAYRKLKADKTSVDQQTSPGTADRLLLTGPQEYSQLKGIVAFLQDTKPLDPTGAQSNYAVLQPLMIYGTNFSLCLIRADGGTDIRTQVNFFTGGHLWYGAASRLELFKFDPSGNLAKCHILSGFSKQWQDANSKTLDLDVTP